MTTGITSSKLVAYGLIGAKQGITCSKVVAYVLLEPGTESGSPPSHREYTYGQRIKKQP
jgi:hypothetical protein